MNPINIGLFPAAANAVPLHPSDEPSPAHSASAARAGLPFDTETPATAAYKRKNPDTISSPPPPPKRHRSGSHPHLSNALSSQSTHRLRRSAGSMPGLSRTQGAAADMHSPFEPSFNVEEALIRHAASRWDKRERGLPRTMIRSKSSGAVYSLQFGTTGSNGKVLGNGGQGKVRIASRHDGKVVAVKKYHRDHDDAPEANRHDSIKEAEVEYFIYQKLGKGRHFPEAYDIAHVKQSVGAKSYLFMELIDGEHGEKVLGEIYQKIVAGKSPKSEAITQVKHIAQQYIEAVADLHDRGVASPDMKPENFMHEPSGNVKIIDFGLAEYFPPDKRAQDEFDGFDEDKISLGVILVDALGRTLLGLRSAYAYGDDEYDGETLQDEFDDALEAMADDDEIRINVEALERLSTALKEEKSPRELLSDSYFADLGIGPGGLSTESPSDKPPLAGLPR